MIQQILLNLSTSQDPELYQQTVASIDEWKQNPFQPWQSPSTGPPPTC